MTPNENKAVPEKIYIGVSWPYANGNIHIGHLAGQYVVCDVFARYHRLKGNDVLMVSGSDSHGAPVVFKAEQEGITPQELAQRSHNEIVDTYNRLGFLYENYTSTTTEIHKKVAQNMFKVLNETGYLDIKKSKQYYDPKVERFLPDRYVKGTCPDCGNDGARGDECPECGLYLEPEDLLNPYSTLSDAAPELRETEHFYLDLRALQEPLSEWATEASKNWRKWVREFSLGWMKQGLEPRPITRDMKYGIPVPVKGWENKVLYVWIEAVIGYLSAAIEWADKQGEPSKWEDFWKNPDAKHFYFIAGGNVPFHTVLWPAEIIAYNHKYSDTKLFEDFKLPGETKAKGLNLPYDVPGNNMLFYRGKKMSKGDSTGVTVESLIETYGPDPIRYFFTKYAPEKQDREFIWADFIEANNCELVGNLGNFIYRTLSFTQARFEGKVPEGILTSEVGAEIDSAFKETSELIEGREFVKSIERVLELGHFANKYFNDEKPWESVKIDPKKAGSTIFNSIQLVEAIRVLLKPYTPFAVDKLTEMLNTPTEYNANKELEEKGRVTQHTDTWVFNGIEAGRKINKPEIIFEKFEYTEELELQDNPPKEVCDRAQNIRFIQTDELSNIPIIWKVYPNVNIKKLKPDQRDELNAEVTEHLKTFDKDWRESLLYTGYKNLHNNYSEQKDYPGSVELLIENTIADKQIPKINSFVDVYNYVSVMTGISIGAHDISKIMGEAKIEILKKDTNFQEISSGDVVNAKKGEYAYTDDNGIICRLDIKQSLRTRISSKTCDILVILQGHEGIGEADLHKGLKLLDEKLKKFEIVK